MPPWLMQVPQSTCESSSSDSLGLPDSGYASNPSAATGGSAASLQPASEWSQHTDFLGRQYYVHKLSGTRQWATPEDWIVGFDENGYQYAYNSITGQSQWVSNAQDETPAMKRNANPETQPYDFSQSQPHQSSHGSHQGVVYGGSLETEVQPHWLQSPGKWSSSSTGTSPEVTPGRQIDSESIWSWWSESTGKIRSCTTGGRVQGPLGSATATRLPKNMTPSSSLNKNSSRRRRTRTQRTTRKPRLRWGSEDGSSSVGADSESETLPRALLYDGDDSAEEEGDIESGMAMPQLTTAAVLTLQDNPNFMVGLSLQDRIEWVASALIGASTKVIHAVAVHGVTAVNKLMSRAAYPSLPMQVSTPACKDHSQAVGTGTTDLPLSPRLGFLDCEHGATHGVAACSPRLKQEVTLCDELLQLQQASEVASSQYAGVAASSGISSRPPLHLQAIAQTAGSAQAHDFVVPARNCEKEEHIALHSAGSVQEAAGSFDQKSPTGDFVFLTPKRDVDRLPFTPAKGRTPQGFYSQSGRGSVVCTPGSVGGSSVASAAGRGCHSRLSSPPSPAQLAVMPFPSLA